MCWEEAEGVAAAAAAGALPPLCGTKEGTALVGRLPLVFPLVSFLSNVRSISPKRDLANSMSSAASSEGGWLSEGVGTGGGVDDGGGSPPPRCPGVRISPLSPELAGEAGEKDEFSMFLSLNNNT